MGAAAKNAKARLSLASGIIVSPSSAAADTFHGIQYHQSLPEPSLQLQHPFFEQKGKIFAHIRTEPQSRERSVTRQRAALN
jgi:hypothetical protein